MPARRKINKDDIVNVCVQIIRKEGIQGLNARKVAKELGCSTQPIFYIYSNLDEMKKDALEKIYQIFDDAMLKSNYDKPVYKDIGKNYIKFAKDEPLLFKLLFNSEVNKEAQSFIDLSGSSRRILETLSSQTGLSEKEAKKFHLRMWLYVNGIANLVANRTINFTDEEIEYLLGEQYISMILYEVRKGNIGEDMVDKFLNNKIKKKDE